jgi:hypothetical protein
MEQEMNEQAFGALLFGTLAMAFVGALALISGDSWAIILAFISITTAYAAQLSYYWYTDTHVAPLVYAGNAFWLICLTTALLSFILSLWS